MSDRAEYQKQYYEEHKDEIKARKAEWYQKNKDRLREKIRDYQREWSKNNPEKVKEKRHRYYIRHRDKILGKQNAKRAEVKEEALSEEMSEKMSEKSETPTPIQRTRPIANPGLVRNLWEGGRSVNGIAVQLGITPEEVQDILKKKPKIPYMGLLPKDC